jgi:hypothetical protein
LYYDSVIHNLCYVLFIIIILLFLLLYYYYFIIITYVIYNITYVLASAFLVCARTTNHKGKFGEICGGLRIICLLFQQGNLRSLTI